MPAVVTGFGSGAPVRRRGRARRLGVFAAVAALMLCVLWAALIGLRWSHFVGVDPATGKVAVYQGVPYDLGGGVKLFTLVHVSRIPAATLPATRRRHLFDHSLRSSESARSLVAQARADRAVSAVGLRSSRNRELGLLLLVAAVVAVGFTSVLVARSGVVSTLSLTYAAAFLALLGVAHVALRVALPDADPVLLPAAGLLVAIGIVEIYRLDPTRARDQAIWLAVGVGCFVALLAVLSDYRVLERYRYLLGVASLARAGGDDRSLVRDRHRRQRRPRVDPRRRPLVPAGRVREGRARALHGRVPAREARAAREPGHDACSASACRSSSTSRRSR